ncbi:MAG: hypothetical protein CMG74_04960 [Candidatus Marinimicrobia bacterium]|nr:hypothetical protein [Candidatus Neomarinimicrobiota bacterium]|tara:strand:- start:3197 stop:4168 length:972 start_codon:yes stop_codon:yes gene_type:complete
MKKYVLSIIIPTHNRQGKIIFIVKKLLEQSTNKHNIEIIISGDKKKYLNLKLFKSLKKKNISIKYLYSRINSNALKRNKAIKLSKGKYIILIDDDCLPAKNFLNSYLNLFKSLDGKTVICGSVKYKYNNFKNKFIRYRQSRHFVISSKKMNFKKSLTASKIVTMNMGVVKTPNLFKTGLFDERFGQYGFEDYEFGFRLINNGFKLKACNPTIYHMDNRNFKSYLNKIYYLSRISVNQLKLINNKLWSQISYSKIDSNILIKFFSKYRTFYFLLCFIENIVVYIEKKSILYLPILYKFGIFLSYCKGYCDRNLKKKIKINKWYE